MGDEWTPCNPQQGAITVNVGDALMYWSDDKLKVRVSQAGCTPSLNADVTCIVTTYFMVTMKELVSVVMIICERNLK